MFPFDIARSESWFINNKAKLDKQKALRVTLIEGRIYSQASKDHYQAVGYQLHTAASLDEALTSLFFKDTDVVVSPEHITLAHIDQNARYRNTLMLAPQEYQPIVYAHIAISKNGRYADKHEAFKQVLEQIMAEGKYRFYQ